MLVAFESRNIFLYSVSNYIRRADKRKMKKNNGVAAHCKLPEHGVMGYRLGTKSRPMIAELLLTEGGH